MNDQFFINSLTRVECFINLIPQASKMKKDCSGILIFAGHRLVVLDLDLGTYISLGNRSTCKQCLNHENPVRQMPLRLKRMSP